MVPCSETLAVPLELVVHVVALHVQRDDGCLGLLLVSLWFSGDGDVAEISGFSRSEKVQNLPASGSSSEVRAHQMARKLRSAGFTPQKSELSSHRMAIIWSCGLPGSLRSSTPSSHQMAMLCGGHLWSHSGGMRRSDYFRFLAWCPCFVLFLGAALPRYEDGGTSQPRPPGSSNGPHSLRSGHMALRFDVSFAGQGFLNESGRR